MAVKTPASPAANSGTQPQLAQLIGLRELVQRRKPAKRGRLGVSGPSMSPLRGRGMEYAESREYQHGDDARHMDWRLTARTGKAHSKVFQVERERLTLLVADTSPRLYFGTRVCFKSVQAARLGAVAVWQAIKDGDRVAALRGSRAEEPQRPASGMRGALPVLNALRRWYTEPPTDDGGLAMAVRHAIRLAKPGTRVVVLADPRSVLDIESSQWAALSQHKELLVLLLTDPLELQPPSAYAAFRSQGQAIKLDLSAAATRDSWDAQFAAPLRQAMADLSRIGVRAAAVSTADAPDAWLDLVRQSVSQVA
ncbi:DUF58 domain-containing protein [Aquilutibacter rugosus]|uniref:DUF58 domain-containing protein n=1 Tax=Aquilutibacter rugosus TaxID=3115820 RepID=UPI002F3EE85E